MFTGIIETTGTIETLGPPLRGNRRVVISSALDLTTVPHGGSIAVDGVCLTAVSRRGRRFQADLGPETLARTTFGRRRAGDRVHLERPLRMGDPLGGHLVAGHVDGVGKVLATRPLGDALTLEVQAPPEVAPYVAPKGSIAIDGVSLTVNEVGARGFSVTLIPHTLSVTNLGRLHPGDPVNLEADLLAKHVARLLDIACQSIRRSGGRAVAEPVPPHISVEQALEQIRDGKMVIVVDDEDRENEGDLTMAADLVTPEAINFMARLGRGLICLSLTEDKVAHLGLTMMTQDNRSLRGTAFTVSIDARQGITTGISARERAHTVLTAVAPNAAAADLVTPGHIFPLKGRRGGVLVRSGHTEAAIDLARLAGRDPAGVICEIMREDGEMARLPDLESVRPGPRPGHRAHRRPHPVPAVARAAGAPAAGDHGPPARRRADRRIQGLRLRHRRRGDAVPGAGAGRGARHARACPRWSGCRPPSWAGTCSASPPPVPRAARSPPPG